MAPILIVLIFVLSLIFCVPLSVFAVFSLLWLFAVLRWVYVLVRNIIWNKYGF